jgi:LPP20 lipoprotein
MSNGNGFGLTAIGLLLGLSLACASQQKPPEGLKAEMAGAPKWAQGDCQAGLPKKNTICGAGSVSGMTNVALARSAAEGRARTELARSLQVRVKSMLKDYQAATQGGPDAKSDSEQHIEDVSKQITDVTLSGTRLQDTFVSDTGTFWALVVLDVEPFKESLSGMKDLDERVRSGIIQRADRAFYQLDSQTRP